MRVKNIPTKLIILIVLLTVIATGSFASSDFATTSYNLADYYYDIGRFDRSIQEIQNILGYNIADTVPDLYQRSLYLLGMNYMKLDQYQVAQECFYRILQNPYTRVLIDESTLQLSLSQVLNEDYLAALRRIDNYTQTSAIGKYAGDAEMLKAETLLILGRREEARALLLEIIEDYVVSPSYFDAIIRLRQLDSLGAPSEPEIVIQYDPATVEVPHEMLPEYVEISQQEFQEYLDWQQELRDWQVRLQEREENLIARSDMLDRKERLLEYQTQVLQDIDQRLQERIQWINDNQP